MDEDFDPLDDLLLSDDETDQKSKIIPEKSKIEDLFATMKLPTTNKDVKNDLFDLFPREKVKKSSFDWLDLKDNDRDHDANEVKREIEEEKEEEDGKFEKDVAFPINSKGNENTSDNKKMKDREEGRKVSSDEKIIKTADVFEVKNVGKGNSILKNSEEATNAVVEKRVKFSERTPVENTATIEEKSASKLKEERRSTGFSAESYVPSGGTGRRAGFIKKKVGLPSWLLSDESETTGETSKIRETERKGWNFTRDRREEVETEDKDEDEKISGGNLHPPGNAGGDDKKEQIPGNSPEKTETELLLKQRRQRGEIWNIFDLRKKREDLQGVIRNQTEALIRQESEIREIASAAIRDQYDNVLSLLQKRIKELEMDEVHREMKVKYLENKYALEMASVEDARDYEMQLAKEREIRLRKELETALEEFQIKMRAQKESEAEILRLHKEKLQIELKQISDVLQGFQLNVFRRNIENSKTLDETELDEREAKLFAKEKRLTDMAEDIRRQKAALNDERESFHLARAKGENVMEERAKELKWLESDLKERELSWERTKQREEEYVRCCKHDLEAAREALAVQERNLMRERFKFAGEKSRLDAIAQMEGISSGNVVDIIQARAEVEGAIKEARALKKTLEEERNRMKGEERKLQEENWRLKSLEQELSAKNKHVQALLDAATKKREEGLDALRKARMLECETNSKMKCIGENLAKLTKQEEDIMQEKIKLSRERESLDKYKRRLDVILPRLSDDEKFNFDAAEDAELMKIKLRCR